ncbi:MAG: tRNA preQ1(34) S-adenosylmethionine ribosyltransferase-isomerase QueA [Planctomycetes bacterium]|nr:tRNA preQ1(34) S-adenosylmethionine ribosyltransferase-isomerase QueA [Planctomycetota bacterium]
MRVADFHYELPADRIASAPVEPRDAARLFVHERALDRSEHRFVRDLPELLRPGDLLVLNDTRVLPHRLVGRLPSGARVEVLILSRDGDHGRGYLKPARKLRINEPIGLEGGALELVPLAALGGGLFRFALRAPRGGDLTAVIEAVGRAPLPPYIRRPDGDDAGVDRARYQTVFARVPGAVAAPTAGLHFAGELLARLAERGIGSAFDTLHVGEGTFAPLRVDRVEDHRMHRERYELPAATATAIAATRARGGRVVAVGTTAARVLETCARDDRTVAAGSGSTELFLFPGRPLRVVDALLTNFHLPGSTLLMLVAAFCGRERVLRLYREAIERGYRFFSYGDAMLLV